MRRVFLDTVGLIAVWDVSDQWHEPAELAMLTLMKSPCITFASESVLLECGNAASRRPYRDDVSHLRRKLLIGERVVNATDEELQLAWDAYDRREASGAGIVDQISFILMRRLGITEAFTNDEHFRSAGFVTLF